VLEHSETPGLGSKMTGEGNPLFASFEGKNPSAMQLKVKKDGGEVDALTAATITSRAYIDAVERAFKALPQQIGGAEVPQNQQGKEASNE
jgi:electron transport complex protein RnfG